MNRIFVLFIVFSTVLLAKKYEIKLSDVESQYMLYPKIEGNEKKQQNINLGFSSTTGNTNSLNLNAKYDLFIPKEGYKHKELDILFESKAFLNRNDNVTENEELYLNFGLEQKMGSDWLVYGATSWLHNRFKNFDNKYSVGTGVGKELYRNKEDFFKFKMGLAHNVEQYSNSLATVVFTSLNQYLEYNNQLNPLSKFYFKIGGAEKLDHLNEYEVLAVAGFKFAVAERLSVSIEGEVRSDNFPPDGFEKTDTKSIVQLGYAF